MPGLLEPVAMASSGVRLRRMGLGQLEPKVAEVTQPPPLPAVLLTLACAPPHNRSWLPEERVARIGDSHSPEYWLGCSTPSQLLFPSKPCAVKLQHSII